MRRLLSKLLLLFITVNAEAAQKLALNEEETLKVNLSRSRINRISVMDDSIRKIIGNADEFEKETDNGQVFIIPRGEIGSYFEVSLNLDSGKTQSVRCRVTNLDEGQIILLTPNNKRYRDNIQTQAIETLRELSVIQGQHSALYNDLESVGQGKVVEAQKIEFKELTGFRILVKNLSRRTIDINEQDLILPGYKVLAVSLDSYSLKTGDKILILAVAQKR